VTKSLGEIFSIEARVSKGELLLRQTVSRTILLDNWHIEHVPRNIDCSKGCLMHGDSGRVMGHVRVGVADISVAFHTDVLVRSFRSANVVRGDDCALSQTTGRTTEHRNYFDPCFSTGKSGSTISHNLDYADLVGTIMGQMGTTHAVSACGEARDGTSLC
jgi:hypothetical protein